MHVREDRSSRGCAFGLRTVSRGHRARVCGPASRRRGPPVDERSSRSCARGLRAEARGSHSEKCGSRVEGRASHAEKRGSRVEGRGPDVEDLGSRVEGRGPHVENLGSRVGRCASASTPRSSPCQSYGVRSKPRALRAEHCASARHLRPLARKNLFAMGKRDGRRGDRPISGTERRVRTAEP
jgi:hypothetical protein